MARLLSVVAALVLTTSAFAHEFWIAPRMANLEPGETLVADLLQGQHLKGNPLRFNPAKFERFAVVGPGQDVDVRSRLGDRPALRQPLAEPGLHVVVYVGRIERTSYFKLSDFAAAAAYEGYEDIAAGHRARNLPTTGFSEAYTRYAKALVRVGTGPSEPDRRLGLPIELVFQDPPEPPGATVRLLLFGEPMAGAQIRIFSRPVGAEAAAPADEVVVRTDREGRAAVPLLSSRRYLLSAVHLREPSATLARERDVVWETLWASTSMETAD